MLPVAIASYSLVGEKIERSLEPLLATPATDGEILLGKGIAAFVPPVAAIWAGAVVFMALAGQTARWRSQAGPRSGAKKSSPDGPERRPRSDEHVLHHTARKLPVRRPPAAARPPLAAGHRPAGRAGAGSRSRAGLRRRGARGRRARLAAALLRPLPRADHLQHPRPRAKRLHGLQIGECTGPSAGWAALWPHLKHYD
jgi:hypothetical protein